MVMNKRKETLSEIVGFVNIYRFRFNFTLGPPSVSLSLERDRYDHVGPLVGLRSHTGEDRPGLGGPQILVRMIG